jgi:sulfur carrier protein ThiS
MTIQLRLFANLARYLPPGSRGDGVALEVPDAAAVGDVVRGLAIPPDLPGLFLVNGQEASPDRRLAAGDLLDVVPPLAGG